MEPTLPAALHCVPLFVGLDADHLQILIQHCRRRKFPAGETLFHQEDPGFTLYVILSGEVSIQRPTGRGTRQIALRKQGDHFGEMALFDNSRRMADAVTVSPCELLMLDRDAFHRCIAVCPQLAINIIVSLSDHLRECAADLERLQELDVLGRVCATLTEMAAAHGVPDAKGGTRIRAGVTQQQIADRIGARRESVTRAFAALKASRAIRFDGRAIIVLDEQRLRRNSNIDDAQPAP